jgi:hypothetical protein
MKGILKYVGKEHWPWPRQHIRETAQRGPSIRASQVPDLDTPYPVGFIHPRGTFTVKGMALEDLWQELANEGHLPYMDRPIEDFIQDGLPTLLFIDTLEGLERIDPDDFTRIVDKYGIEFRPALTHYSYITGVQVVVGKDGEHMDKVQALRAKGIDAEPVIVIPVEAKDE